MKIEFDPQTDTPTDVAVFAQECFDKGMKIVLTPIAPLKGLPAPTDKTNPKKRRGPQITRSIYNRIKAGDVETQSQYSRAAISAVVNTKSWQQFVARKERKVANSRAKKSMGSH